MYPQTRKPKDNGAERSATGQQSSPREKRKKKRPIWKQMVALAVDCGMPREEVLRRMTKDRHGNATFSPPVDVELPSAGMVKLESITVDTVERVRRIPGGKLRWRPLPKTATIIQEGQRGEVPISVFFPSTKA
ncbi:MAG: hypothetical protein HQ530_05855 [Parcubacteria group bacterium]|nr:hypothetical protein [Parcubacteria group bacterium]